jgi:Caspase domain
MTGRDETSDERVLVPRRRVFRRGKRSLLGGRADRRVTPGTFRIRHQLCGRVLRQECLGICSASRWQGAYLRDLHKRLTHSLWGHVMRFLKLWMMLAMVGLIDSSHAFAETRIALVIGNSTYQNVPRLNNSNNDARLMADTLRGLGFTLVGGSAQLDLDKTSFDNAVRSFGRQLLGADVALFYYAGHGLQVRGANYLVPINANPGREADLDFELEDVALVLRQMEGSGTRLNLVFPDACRNNPFGGRGLRAIESGLAQMRAPEGTLISFATQPGSVALDGNDGHSPFTNALARTIRKPGLGIFDAMNEVGLAVKQATGGSQQPWFSTSPIGGSFYFASAPNGTQVPSSTNAPTAVPPHVTVAPPVPKPPRIANAPATLPRLLLLLPRSRRHRHGQQVRPIKLRRLFYPRRFRQYTLLKRPVRRACTPVSISTMPTRRPTAMGA